MTLGWLILGGVLMVAELAIPGLIVVFFGAAALLVGAASALGLVPSLGVGVGLWLASSTGLVLGVRGGMKRLAAGEMEKGSTDEALDAFGQRVEVIDELSPTSVGRIRFQGSTWPARTVEETLAPGAFATIVTRDNLVWIVEADETLALSEGDAEIEAKKKLEALAQAE